LPQGALVLETPSLDRLSTVDVVFLALPHGASAALAAGLLERGVRVVDLGADFRLSAGDWQRAYGSPHAHPELLATARYALVEQGRVGADERLLALPGCYPTAVSLAALPLLSLGVDHVVADCLSGVSGAGRSAKPGTTFCAVNEGASAYGLAGTHRHTVEMEQVLGVPVSFTPHLVPMQRGLLATVKVRPHTVPRADELQHLLTHAYGPSPVVHVVPAPPSTHHVRGTARALVHGAVDVERGVVTTVCVIDNLLKGAGGQAIQALNHTLGWPQEMGLPLIPVM
jgi:N-acetyl-gamma-glutamyl-phosphate reductase